MKKLSRKTKNIVRASLCGRFVLLFIFGAFSLSAFLTVNFTSARSDAEAPSGRAAEMAVEEKQEVKTDAVEGKDIEDDAIVGEADEFEQNEKTGVIILLKNVRIKRKNGYLNADKVTIYRDQDTKKVLKTVAEGNVDMKDGEILATCENAVLNEADDTIELTGKVIVTQGDDRVEAPEITYDRKTGIRKGKGNANQRVKFRVRLQEEEPKSSEEKPSEAEEKPSKEKVKKEKVKED